MSDWYFIGIGGIGMSGLARVLLDRGETVSGSDTKESMTTRTLVERGATIHSHHCASHLPKHAPVVWGSGVARDNPELQAAKASGRPLLHRSELLEELTSKKNSLAIAGSHGKTTTSSLLAWTLNHTGHDPSFVVGGWISQLNTNAQHGKGEFFVFEADESDGTFVNYHPSAAIITNIDTDHLDQFNSLQGLSNAVQKFASQVQISEHIVWNGDDLHLRGLSLPGVSYGFEGHNTVQIKNYQQTALRSLFDLEWNGKTYEQITLALPGRHNVLNAAAVWTLGLLKGIAESDLRQGLSTFPGVGRRFEHKGTHGDVAVFDDYAHHPTEIAATLKSLRSAVGGRRIIAVYQPHRYTRTRDCLGSFKSIFEHADEVLITDIFQAREEAIAGLTSETIAEEVRQSSSVSVRTVSRQSLRTTLVALARPHDVFITLGAGDVTQLADELVEHFNMQPARRWVVGVLCGGVSVEHEVSCMSAEQIIPQLSNNKYDVRVFGIAKHGEWIVGDDVLKRLKASASQSKGLSTSARVSAAVLEELSSCDVLLPMLHGSNGEDGTVQGLLHSLGKAYAGPDTRAGAVAMDKVLTKQLARDAGVPIVPFLSFSRDRWVDEPQTVVTQVSEELNWPLYVKPRNLGSSIETHKVCQLSEFESAVQGVLSVDHDVLVEEAVQGRELEFAVMGWHKPVVFPPGEIFSNGETHTYEGKYFSETATPDSPRAILDEPTLEQGLSLARKVYQTVRCSGMARIDFFLLPDGSYLLNEVNPIPGFTKNSMFPKICEANGLSISEVLDQLIISALARHRSQRRLDVSRVPHSQAIPVIS